MKENLFYPDWRKLRAADASEVQFFFLKNLYKIIEINLGSSALSIGYLSKKMAISKSTLNRKLSYITGLFGSELIRQCRLRKAVIFLSKGKVSG